MEITLYPLIAADDATWATDESAWSPNNFLIGYGATSYRSYIRFPNVTIPQGYTITSAILTFTSLGTDSGTTVVNMSGNNVDTSVAPTSASEGNALALTTANVSWSPTSWSYGSPYDSPDIKSVIQEIVNRGSWASGNAIGITIYDDGSAAGAYRACGRIGSGTAAKLVINYIESTYFNINSSLNIRPIIDIHGSFMKGFVGDIESRLVIPISMGGTINYIPIIEISGSIPITIGMSGTMLSPVQEEGNSSVSIPALVVYGEAEDEVWGYASVVIPMFNTSGSVGVIDELGNAVPKIPALSLQGTSEADEIGSADLYLPILTTLGAGEDTILGTATISLPRLTLQSLGIAGDTGTVDIKLSMLTLSASGLTESVGEASVSIPMLTLSTSSHDEVFGTGSVTIPLLTLFASSEATTAFLSMVMNIRNRALTLYDNYDFNSLLRFNNKHLGMTATKIYDLDSGTTDDGVLIDWNFRTGYLDFHQKVAKKLRQAWFSYKSDGDLIITVVLPDGTQYEYDLTGYEITEDGVRVKFGKGLKNKYISLDIKNIDGSDITLDTIKLHFDKLSALR